MEIYIAAPFDWRVKAKRVRENLERRGYVSTSTWIDSHLDEIDLLTDADRWKEAHQDLLDVHRAQEFVLLNGPSTAGGMHLELGFALAKGKPVWLIGERTSIFHYHPNIHRVDDVSEIPDANISRL